MLSTSVFPNVAYVMDDGLTGACAVDVNQSTNGIGIGNSNDDYMVMTFIGTGVTYTSAHGGQPGPWDVATNLPYGSHTFMITRDTDASDTGKMRLDGVELWDQPSGKYGMRYPEDISFLQPKMPPIPENAVVIADYMLMADFVKQANSNDTSISKGVRALSGSRDIYVSAASALQEGSNNEINYLPYGIEAYASPGGSGHTGDGEIAWFGTQAVSLLQNHASAHIIQLNGSTVATSAIDSSRNDKSDGRTLNAPAAILGTNKIKTKMLVGGYGFQGYYLQTPIHTSSHYQLFEAPYLKELVGGDRNMEQTNLVVTADGKTWDQLTRDTSYIGNVCIFTTNDENISNGSSVQMFDDWRGTYQNHKMWLNKDFAINYDKTICLVDGWYEIRTQTLRKGAHGHCNIKINGTAVLYGHGGSSNHDTPNTTLTIFLKRGDTVQIFGSWYQDRLFSHHQITRIPKG